MELEPLDWECHIQCEDDYQRKRDEYHRRLAKLRHEERLLPEYVRERMGRYIQYLEVTLRHWEKMNDRFVSDWT